MAKLDEHLRRELDRLIVPGDPTGVAEGVARRRTRHRRARRIGSFALALAVVGGTVAGAWALWHVFKPQEASRIGSEPAPAQESSGEIVPIGSLDIGCFRSVVRGDFDGDGSLDAAYGSFLPEGEWDTTRPPDEQCADAAPEPEHFVITIEMAGQERLAVLIQIEGPCGDDGCRVLAAPDIDADGRAELAVVLSGSAHEFGLYRVAFCKPSEADCADVERIEIAAPGDPATGFAPGPATFRWGGYVEAVGGAYCLPKETGHDPSPPRFVAWDAYMLEGDPDSWRVLLAVFVPRDRSLELQNTASYLVPEDEPNLPPGGGRDFCGAPTG